MTPDAKGAALDSASTMFSVLQMGAVDFTEATREAMKADLDSMREMLCQMRYTGKDGENHSSDEWWFVVSRVAVGAMCMYLSGALDRAPATCGASK